MERARCNVRDREFRLRGVECDVDKVEVCLVNGSGSVKGVRLHTLLPSWDALIQLRLGWIDMTREGDVGLLVVFCDGGVKRGCG
jgi:hypothetical protein